MVTYVFLCVEIFILAMNFAEPCRSQNFIATGENFIFANDNSTYEYGFSSSSFDKSQSEAYCSELESTIADRFNESDFNDLEAALAPENLTLNTPYYLGITLNSEQYIVTKTGNIVPMTSPLWGEGQPTITNDCVVLDMESSLVKELRLFTTNCSALHRVVCQRLRGSPWSEWQSWSSCSSSCQRARTRECAIPRPYGGQYCNKANETQIELCNNTASINNLTVCIQTTTANSPTTAILVNQSSSIICDNLCPKDKVIVGTVIGVVVLVIIVSVVLYLKFYKKNNDVRKNTATSKVNRTSQNNFNVRPTSQVPMLEARSSRDPAPNSFQAAPSMQKKNDESEYVNFAPSNDVVISEDYLQPIPQRQPDYENGEEIYVNEPGSPALQNEEEYVAMQQSTYVNFHSP